MLSRILKQILFKALKLLKISFTHLPIILKEYGTNTPRISTLLSILKLGGMIIVTEILTYIDSPNDWKTGKGLKGLSKRQNITFLTEKSKKSPTKIVALGSS